LPGAPVVLGGQRVGAQGEAFEAGVDLRVEVERGLVQVGADEDHRAAQLAELGVEVLQEVEHVAAVLVGHVEEVAVVDEEQPHPVLPERVDDPVVVTRTRPSLG
jgi:hypothetical protein